MKQNGSLKKPLFLGLSHIGQVFSIGWISKIGKCAVYDFDQKRLRSFIKKDYTYEEPNLSKFKKFSKFSILKDNNEIKNYKVIFLTIDTSLNKNTATPNTKIIENNYKKLSKIKFSKKVKVFLLSQVPIGFTNFLKKKYKNKNIELIYMVDTLQMGVALEKFLNPSYLVFGGNQNIKKFIIDYFKSFKCKKYLINSDEAELLKMSTNLFLFFNVMFANSMDDLSKQYGLNFSKITSILRNDLRIGNDSYINPSIAISGGHLERDCFYFKNLSSNILNKKIFEYFLKFNQKRKRNLLNRIFEINKPLKKIKLLIIGISYKKNSFSMINSIFKDIINSKKINLYYYDDYFNKNPEIKIKKIDTLKKLKEIDCILVNYCKHKTLMKLKEINRNNKIKIIDISNNTNNIFKPHVKFFENNIKHI